MSLLMEALRKAEEAKRRMQQEEQAAAPGRDSRDVADAHPSSASPGNTSNSPFTLEDREDLTPEYIRDNFATAQTQPEISSEEPEPFEPPAPEPDYKPEPDPNARNVARRQQRAAAASVFQAKQGPAKNRKALTILVIVMVLMIPLGGGVLWYLQSMPSSSISVNPALANYDLSSRSLSDTLPTAPAPAAASPAAGAAIAENQPQAPAVASASASQETARAETTDAAEAPADVPQETVTETVAAAPAEPAPDTAVAIAPPPLPGIAASAADAAADASAVPAEAAPPVVLEISRTRSTSQVNPDLVAAYESLQSGDLATSGRLYQQLLDLLPNNRDAMLGLALVRQRQNDPVRARELYARLLQLNPRDALAQTGLLQTMQITDPAEHEKALQRLIGEYPDVAQLTLALGNLYASQQRWSEAQGAYYNALLTASRSTAGPVNPDYAFNLAVSLEQLDEPKAALEYYRQAQALARVVTPGFDLQLLNSRLDYLSTQAQP